MIQPMPGPMLRPNWWSIWPQPWPAWNIARISAGVLPLAWANARTRTAPPTPTLAASAARSAAVVVIPAALSLPTMAARSAADGGPSGVSAPSGASEASGASDASGASEASGPSLASAGLAAVDGWAVAGQTLARTPADCWVDGAGLLARAVPAAIARIASAVTIPPGFNARIG